MQTTVNISNYSFKMLSIPQLETQKRVVKNMTPTQFEELVDLFEKENSNPVKALIYSDNKLFLKAKIIYQSNIQNFKGNYMQIPFFESKLNFIKRIAKLTDKYQESLCSKQ